MVDQAEEAVTLCADPAEREDYFAALATHAAGGGPLVLSMRTDHLGDLAPYPEMAQLLQDGFFLLGPMSEPDLRSAVEGPARRAGLRLEPGLVDLLIREVEGEPAALPLLSHVLRETWERREGPTLTVEGYRATGRIRSAVSQTAERLYDGMDPEQRSRLRTLLLRLVMPTEDGDPVRARVPRSKVAADHEHQRLVEQLVDARLVSIDGDSVQIAHEALVRVWPRLRGWLDDDIDGQRLFRHLSGAADAWDAMGRPESELYRGARLARTLEWRDRAGPFLSDAETAFLDASAAHAESEVRAAEVRLTEQHRANLRLRGALAAVCVLLVVALVAELVAVRAADRVAHERDRAEQAAILADARRASAQGVLHEDLTAGLLLAVQGVKFDDSAEAWENLGSTLTRAGALAGVHDVGREVGRTGTAYFSSLTASSDGSLLVGCLWDGGAHLFDAATLGSLPFTDDTPQCASVAFSPAGDKLAVAGAYSVHLRLYDVSTRALSAQQPGGFPESWSVAFLPWNHADVSFSGDGDRFAAQLHRVLPNGDFARLGRVMVWDTSDPSEPVFSIVLPQFSHLALSARGDRLYVITERDPSLRVYDVDSGRLLAAGRDPLIAATGANAAALSPDGSTLAVAMGDRVIRFDTRTLRRKGVTLTGHRAPVVDIDFSHDGRLLATTSEDGTAAVWDGRTAERLHRFAEGEPSALAFSRDDRRLFTVGHAGLVQAWNVAGAGRQLTLGEETSSPEEGYDVSAPAPDGHTVARIRSGRLWFEDTRTGETTPEPARIGAGLSSLAWSSDSRWLLSVRGGLDGPKRVVTLWNTSNGSVSARSDPFTAHHDVLAAFSRDAKQVFVHDAAFLHTLDATTLRPAYPPTAAAVEASELAPHPDGSVFVLAADGSFLRVDPRAGKVIDTAQRGLLNSEDVSGVLSPDGTRMVVNGPGSQVRLLDVEKHVYVDSDAGFSWSYPTYAPDGSQYAAVAEEEGRIRLWDGHTGRYQASLSLPSRVGRYSITYRPDSSALVIASTDGRTWTVNTRIDRWVDRACAIAARNLSLEEWEEYFPNVPYERTCPQWPRAS